MSIVIVFSSSYRFLEWELHIANGGSWHTKRIGAGLLYSPTSGFHGIPWDSIDKPCAIWGGTCQSHVNGPDFILSQEHQPPKRRRHRAWCPFACSILLHMGSWIGSTIRRMETHTHTSSNLEQMMKTIPKTYEHQVKPDETLEKNDSNSNDIHSVLSPSTGLRAGEVSSVLRLSVTWGCTQNGMVPAEREYKGGWQHKKHPVFFWGGGN